MDGITAVLADLRDNAITAIAGGVGDDSGRGASRVDARSGEMMRTGVSDVPSGIYYVRMTAGRFTGTVSMMYVK